MSYSPKRIRRIRRLFGAFDDNGPGVEGVGETDRSGVGITAGITTDAGACIVDRSGRVEGPAPAVSGISGNMGRGKSFSWQAGQYDK